MAAKNGRRLLVFLDFRAWEHEQIVASLREIEDFFRGRSLRIPLHWILKPHQMARLWHQESSEGLFLKDRIVRQKDKLIPTTFSGLTPASLYPDEWRRDVSLPYTHPTLGLSAWTAQPPGPVFCPEPPLRDDDGGADPPELWYRESTRIGDRLVLRRGKEESWIPILGPNAAEHKSSGALWLDRPGFLETLGRIDPVIAASEPQDLTRLPTQTLRSQENDSQAPSPAAKAAWDRVAGARRREEFPVAGFFHRPEGFPGPGIKEAADSEETLGGIRKRTLVANMQGQTRLHNGPLEVLFRGGRLHGLRVADQMGDRPRTLALGGRTWLRWEGRDRDFSTISAFSLEGDFSWGLRETLALDGPGIAKAGRLVADYFFVEESSAFFVSVSVRHPVWTKPQTIESWGLMEIPILEMASGQSLTVRSVWADGTVRERLLPLRKGDHTLRGCDFVVSAGGGPAVIVGFPQNQTPRPQALPLRIRKTRGRWRLFLNPEGGYEPRPSRDFEGWEEHFTFYIALWNGQKLPWSLSRKEAGELIAPFVKRAGEASREE